MRSLAVLLACVAALAASVLLIVRANGDDDPTPAPQFTPSVPAFEVYVPPALDATRPHPLVFGSSPSGNARELLPVWRQTCDDLGWILVMSANFRNGPYSERDRQYQLLTLAIVEAEYPVDRTRVYATGLSGAAMHAHDLVADEPGKFRGAIVNTGMMPHHMAGNDPVDVAHYPRGKDIVFLASPADSRYPEMQEDRRFLEGLGWHAAWLEFPGGHTYAPPALYEQAARWLASQ